jgi:hypothetical protein
MNLDNSTWVSYLRVSIGGKNVEANLEQLSLEIKIIIFNPYHTSGLQLIPSNFS